MSDEGKTDDIAVRQNMEECQFDSENDAIESDNDCESVNLDSIRENVKSNKRSNAGRPSKYWPELHNGLARAYAMAGLPLDVIAGRLDIAVSTLYEWRDKYSEFAEALSAGKQYADEVVEASLFQRATGYDHKAVKIFMPANAEEPVYAPYVEHVPPDVTAAKLWLTNRKPKQWKEKVDVGISGAIATSTLPDSVVESLSPEAKAELAQAYAQALGNGNATDDGRLGEDSAE